MEGLEARARDVLSLIGSFRNMLQPVNRLPPEIFSRIVQDIPHPLIGDTSSIIVLTHVCRYWRETIVSTPGNWTMISSWNEDLMALSLERSKAAPLTLRLRTNEVEGMSGFSDLIIRYIKNVKNLRIDDIYTAGQVTQILPGFPQSMPILQSLDLQGIMCEEWDQSIDPFGQFPLTPRYLRLVDFPLYPSLLRLRALTELVIGNYDINLDLHLDTLLDFLAVSHSLESATLHINFAESSLRRSRRRTATGNQLQYLLIRYRDVMDGKALVSNIALRRGARLEIDCRHEATSFNDFFSGIPTTHLSNLPLPTSITYESTGRIIRLLGPNGSFSFGKTVSSHDPFIEFPLLPLTNIRKFHLIHSARLRGPTPVLPVFQPSFFPALETFTIDCDVSVSHLLSNVLSNPSSLPSLETLGFLDCDLSADFMEALAKFASDRKNTTSSLLNRVVIVNSSGNFPSALSTDALGKHVPVVDVSVGSQLPGDLVWKEFGRYTGLPTSSAWRGRL